jgi:hypothetical protein
MITHAFWILGAAALLAGCLFCLQDALQAIRFRASLLGFALITASIILWPARVWIAQHRTMGTADPTLYSIITVALWLALAAIPLAIIGRPRLAPLIVLASVITFVFWFRTAVPPQTSLWTVLHISNPTATNVERASSPAKPTPALSKSDQQTAPTPVRAPAR